MAIDTIIWDLGGVLIDWNPKYVFDENYFDSEKKREALSRNDIRKHGLRVSEVIK